jgi:predicted phage baseplate assembly protein
MPLPAPALDDRRFQDLVDDAKRLVQQRCPEWTDHNVSDPGVTLIEAFAWMTDVLIYRLNRVPDLNYVKFLDLLGVTLFPPTPARCPVTFWLSAPREDGVRIPAGTPVSSRRTGTQDPIAFTTTRELDIVPCSVRHVASRDAGGTARLHDSALSIGAGAACFSPLPQEGDTFLVGLTDVTPSCIVVLALEFAIAGIGIDPDDPPIAWEAWNGSDWVQCEVERDGTGGLNRPGDVVLHVPSTHQTSLEADELAGWIRCRVTGRKVGQPRYAASPEIRAVRAYTIGGTVDAIHAEPVHNEVVGTSQGIPGQRFPVERRPVVDAEAERVLLVERQGRREEWHEVTSFADSDEDDRHFQLDRVAGEVVLGPAVRMEDGSLRSFGAVPPKNATLRLRTYFTGGGPRGNVARGALAVLRTPIPYISSVENRVPATGGVAGEDVESAKVRGPITLRTGDRAVTAEDYEQLAREAAPDLARVVCVPAPDDDADAGAARVLIVPSVPVLNGRLRFSDLEPREELVHRIARHLDERRVIGVRIVVEPPLYRSITVVARIRARPDADRERLRRDALHALYGFFNPVEGGPEANGGWPFGRPVLVGEAYALLQGLRGVDVVEDVRLFAADPATGVRGPSVDRLDLPQFALVYSYEHRVVVEAD